MINFCPPQSSTGKWVVLRRELGGDAVDKKSVAVGIGVGYQEDPRWAKNQPHWFGGGGGGGGGVGGGRGFEKPPELYCMLFVFLFYLLILFFFFSCFFVFFLISR